MGEIKVVPKPDNISWEQICDLLHRSHLNNARFGFVMKTANLTPDFLERKSRDGITFVALDGDRLVGTGSVCKKKSTGHWYDKGKQVHYFKFDAVDPDFQGRGIHKMLLQVREQWSVDDGSELIIAGTHERNFRLAGAVMKRGFVRVGYLTSRTADYYSDVFALWPQGCPYSKFHCRFHYIVSRILVRLRYKPGKKPRFPLVESVAGKFHR